MNPLARREAIAVSGLTRAAVTISAIMLWSLAVVMLSAAPIGQPARSDIIKAR
jgi:hypothetical protein